jgi:hypothetical protein
LSLLPIDLTHRFPAEDDDFVLMLDRFSLADEVAKLSECAFRISSVHGLFRRGSHGGYSRVVDALQGVPDRGEQVSDLVVHAAPFG